jgi:uncharacterized protein YndB with AHSA1/START domain
MTSTARNPSTPVGLTRDAGWEIGVRRTVEATVDQAWDLLNSAEGLALWLGRGAELGRDKGTPYRTEDGTHGELRSWRDGDRVRLTWQPQGAERPSTVQVTVSGARSGRTTIGFHHERLVDADERERMRAHWSAVLDRLAATLEPASD